MKVLRSASTGIRVVNLPLKHLLPQQILLKPEVQQRVVITFMSIARTLAALMLLDHLVTLVRRGACNPGGRGSELSA